MQITSLKTAPVSVVIPCYRCAGTIDRAVLSVARQTLRPYEVILVDDGSGDGTAATLQRLESQYPGWVRVVLMPENCGVASARNLGWEFATQPYIAFLDSDDVWHPLKVEIQYGYMSSHPDVVLCGHASRTLDDPQELPNWEAYIPQAHVISKWGMLLSNRFITPSVMLRRDITFRFDEGQRHMEDHLLWSKIICAGQKVVKLDSELAATYKYAFGVSGLSGQSHQMHQADIMNYQKLSRLEMLGRFSSIGLMCFSWIKYVRRLSIIWLIGIFQPSVLHILDYMSVTYSITGLLVILGITGQHELAGDVAIAQGAVMATFYVMSGDARHLILSGVLQPRQILYFRLILALPLGLVALFLCLLAGNIDILIAAAIVLRRGTEWLVEVHLSEIEHTHQQWRGLPIQILLLLLVVFQLEYSNENWLLWLWALAPLVFSVPYLFQAKRCNLFHQIPHITPTLTMGLSIYVIRVFVLSLAGKQFAGMLFSAVSIGSFAGTLYANVAGPTLLKKGLALQGKFILFPILWGATGIVLSLLAVNDDFTQALGLSLIGGAIMLFAQQNRLLLIKNENILRADLLMHMVLYCAIPAFYYGLGKEWLKSYYLINALLAFVFYRGSAHMLRLSETVRHNLVAILSLLIVTPIFIQLSGHIYNSSLPIVDSGGKLLVVPLPVSIIACYLGLIIWFGSPRAILPALMTVGTLFFTMVLSSLATGQAAAKLLLLVQFIMPLAALILGWQLVDFDRKRVVQTFLGFLLVFVPFHIVVTWLQHRVALTHNLYFFGVYQHYQYVPVIIAALFTWSWVELQDTRQNTLYFLAPWMGIYVSAGNSILALAGLCIFSVFFALWHRKNRSIATVSLLILFASAIYMFINMNVVSFDPATGQAHAFAGKFDFDSISGTPVNVTQRLDDWSRYSRGIIESPQTLLFGHATPPPRSEGTSAHNYYLDLAYNFGVLAWLPILGLLGYTAVKFRKCKKVTGVGWLFAIIIYLVLIDSNMKVTLRQPYPAIVIFFLWGALLAILNEVLSKKEIGIAA